MRKTRLSKSGWRTCSAVPLAKAAAALHQNQLIGQLRGKVQFVGDHDGDEAFRDGEMAQQAEHLNLVADVEVGRGFVQEHELGPLGESSGQNRPLEFPAAHFQHAASRKLRQAGLFHCPVNPAFVFGRLEETVAQVRVASLANEFTHLKREQ